MAEGSVGSTEGEGIREGRDPDTQVRGNAVGPEVAQVGTVGDERETWQPRGVEACSADYHVDLMFFAGMVDEACGGYRVDVICEYGCVISDERLEIAWRRRRTATARVEVLGYHLLDKTGVIVELLAHFAVGVFTCETGFLAAFEDEFEALVELVFNLFTVFEVFLGILFEELELLIAV